MALPATPGFVIAHRNARAPQLTYLLAELAAVNEPCLEHAEHTNQICDRFVVTRAARVAREQRRLPRFLIVGVQAQVRQLVRHAARRRMGVSREEVRGAM